MEESREALRPRMDLKDYFKLQAIKIVRVHQFIAEAAAKKRFGTDYFPQECFDEE
ncbi:MAG: hypothetical protein QXH20_03155 [Candidatus Bathyarchaeia archaeon]